MYICYKPWVGENYHLQEEKVLILICPMDIPKAVWEHAPYTSVIEQVLIDYVSDFVEHRFDSVRNLTQISQILARQKIEQINRKDLWAKYACYSPYIMLRDRETQGFIKKTNEYASQELYEVLETLQPDKIIVASHVVFDYLPTPPMVHEFEIENENFEYTMNGEVHRRTRAYEHFAIKEYIIHDKPIYAVKMINPIIVSLGNFLLFQSLFRLDKYAEYIEGLKQSKGKL